MARSRPRRGGLRERAGQRDPAPRVEGQPRAWPMLIGLMAAVALAVLATHWPALSAEALSFDDNQYLTENKLVRNPSWSTAGRFLGEVLEPSTVRGYYQPLAMISLMLDVAMGGGPDNLRPFHRTSLALHVCNALLIVLLLYLLFGRPWVAAMVGLLYGVHPMTVEPIPWVGERKTVLTTFFALWSLVIYVRYAQTSRWRWIVGSIGAYVLALMSKPTSTPLPVLMLLLDYWPLRRLSRRAVLEKIPLLAIGAISAVVTTISQARTAAVATPAEYSPMVIPLTLCHNIVFYPLKTLWPVGLSPHYPYPKPFDLSQPMVLAGVIGTCVLIPMLLLSWRWTRAVLVGWMIFFVAIFPTMGVIGFTHSIASDKYAYLPSVGLLLILAWALGNGWQALGRDNRLAPGRLAMMAVVLIVAGVAMVASRRQLGIWKNTERHFRYMLTLAPDVRVLHSGLADAVRIEGLKLMDESKGRSADGKRLLAEAIRHYRMVLRPGKDSPFGRNDQLTCAAGNNLANLLAQQGAVNEAIDLWRRVLAMNPENVNAHNNIGIALSWQGNVDEAIRHYQIALDLERDLPETHVNLGLALARKGRPDLAIEHYMQALRLKPGFDLAIRNLTATLRRQGKSDQEIRAYLQSQGVGGFGGRVR